MGFRGNRLFGVVGLGLLLLGCAGRAPVELIAPEEVPRPQPVAAPAVVEIDAEALYGELEVDRLAYEEGIELLASGEELQGEAQIALASASIRAGASRCAEASNCDMERFLGTFESLLRRQEIALKQQAFHIDSLEADMAQDVEREPGTDSFTSAMPEIGRTVSLLRGTELREIITLNTRVRAAIDDWLTWMRPMLMDAYHNYQFLRSEIAPVYEEAGLPEALLFAMIATETGGKVHSYSRAGAAGLLQFMRRTGQSYGLRVVDGFDQRLDPVAATRANVAYLNDQFEVLNDDLELALAAYNGGETRMKRLHRRNRGATFWDSKIYWSLPTETREYVPRILAAAWLFLHPEDYNLEFPELQTATTELFPQQPIAIDELTVCLGQTGSSDGWFRTLRNLNPRLEPGQRVEAGESLTVPESLVALYEQQCTDEEMLARVRELHDANYPDTPEMQQYVVRSGDTLGKIASRHRCVSLNELASLNRIRPPRYVIRVGQRIKIPGCS